MLTSKFPPELKRIGFLPVIGTEGDITSSKFGGKPFTDEDHKDPGFPLLLQLHVDTLPEEAKEYLGLDTGYIQLFYSRESSFEHDAIGSPCRYFKPVGEYVDHEGGCGELYEEKFITEWEPFTEYDGDDFPLEKYTNQGFSFNQIDTIIDMIHRSSVFKDKLMGAPAWCQGPEYSKCKKCGIQKRHVFHIESNQNVDIMFGDMGSGQLQQCPNCKDVFSFGWACC
ncbi:hypothetical protein GEMRC1_001679 [Eukaryota sp. GEM-RC1]